MLNIKKQHILNENNEIISVIIDYKDYIHLEETLENFGLAQLMDAAKSDEYLDKNEALEFYKKQMEKSIAC